MQCLTHHIHPITAVQTEYSLFERTVERLGILIVLQELGIGFVAYSPLGRGFITGNIQRIEDISEDDFRRTIPRYQGEQFNKNIVLLNELEKVAKEKGITTAQLAIAWVIGKGYVPIPGTKKRKYIEQNMKATQISLSEAELQRLETIIPLETNTGLRYSEAVLKNIDMQ